MPPKRRRSKKVSIDLLETRAPIHGQRACHPDPQPEWRGSHAMCLLQRQQGEVAIGRLSPAKGHRTPSFTGCKATGTLPLLNPLPGKVSHLLGNGGRPAHSASLDSGEKVRGVMQLKGLQVRVREIKKRAGGTARGVKAQSDVCQTVCGTTCGKQPHRTHCTVNTNQPDMHTDTHPCNRERDDLRQRST